MDLVRILRESIAALPPGDHTSGLAAILKHVTVAIKHFDGGADAHGDRFTDAIYRTNQAYEGSLKEAYRVLAGKDPSRKSPSDIEKYIEDGGILRPRVLTQITRYRQDYRNPSTHDHKIDFDQNEALLAIIATCGFAKLLVDQIHEKLSFETAKEAPIEENEQVSAGLSSEELALLASKNAQVYLTNNSGISNPLALRGSLAGVFSSAGFNLSYDQKTPLDDTWDIYLEADGIVIPVEVRLFSAEFNPNDHHALGYIDLCLKRMDSRVAVNVMHAHGSEKPVKVFKISIDDRLIFAVTQYSEADFPKILEGISAIEIVPD